MIVIHKDLKIILFYLALPGAGKGASMDEMKRRHTNFNSFSSGDEFRRIGSRDDQLGKLIRAYTDAGELVPDEKTLELMTPKINSLVNEGFEYLGLDGIPRTVPQAKFLLDTGLPIRVCEIVGVDDDVCFERIMSAKNRGDRLDDKNAGTVRKRIALAHKHTDPVAEFIKENYPYLYFAIDGQLDPAGKADQIEQALGMKRASTTVGEQASVLETV